MTGLYWPLIEIDMESDQAKHYQIKTWLGKLGRHNICIRCINLYNVSAWLEKITDRLDNYSIFISYSTYCEYHLDWILLGFIPDNVTVMGSDQDGRKKSHNIFLRHPTITSKLLICKNIYIKWYGLIFTICQWCQDIYYVKT